MARMDRLEAMTIFTRVARRRSFAAAARELRQSPTAVSRKIAELEEHLGVRLLRRTTRSVTLTEVGATYLERCEDVLASLEEAESVAREQHTRPRGKLRVAVGVSFAAAHVSPLVPSFLAAHPGIELDLVIGDRHVDLVAEGVDLALRIGVLGDSSLLARRLAPIRHVVCASPTYVERRGAPEAPADLAAHACLIDTNQPREWWFEGEGGAVTVTVSGPLRANSADAMRTAALAGLGIAYLPTFACGADLARGALVPLLPRYPARTMGLHAVFPAGRRTSARAQAFVEYVRAHLGDPPPWDVWSTTNAG